MSISLGRAPKILWAAIEVTVGAGELIRSLSFLTTVYVFYTA